MTRSEVRYMVLALGIAIGCWALINCGQKTTVGTTITSGKYWSFVMSGNSTGTIIFGQPVGTNIVLASNSTGNPWNTSGNQNLYISEGLTTDCQVMSPGTTVVSIGGQSGSVTFVGVCDNEIKSNATVAGMTISLGNSSASIFDSSGSVLVKAGTSVTGTIIAPGATGASTGNVLFP